MKWNSLSAEEKQMYSEKLRKLFKNYHEKLAEWEQKVFDSFGKWEDVQYIAKLGEVRRVQSLSVLFFEVNETLI